MERRREIEKQYSNRERGREHEVERERRRARRARRVRVRVMRRGGGRGGNTVFVLPLALVPLPARSAHDALPSPRPPLPRRLRHAHLSRRRLRPRILGTLQRVQPRNLTHLRCIPASGRPVVARALLGIAREVGGRRISLRGRPLGALLLRSQRLGSSSARAYIL